MSIEQLRARKRREEQARNRNLSSSPYSPRSSSDDSVDSVVQTLTDMAVYSALSDSSCSSDFSSSDSSCSFD